MFSLLNRNKFAHHTHWSGVARLSFAVIFILGLFAPSRLEIAPAALAQTTESTITLDIREFVANMPEGSGAPVAQYTYLINEDNSGDPFDPSPDNHPSIKPMASYSPIVAAGDETSSTITLQPGRYLISVRGLDDPNTPDVELYKLWGKHIRICDPAAPPLPAGAGPCTTDGPVLIELTPEPLPLSRLLVHVFHDWAPTNAAADIVTQEGGLAGFHIVIRDVVGEVTVDWFGNPLCTQYSDFPGGTPIPGTGGQCVTDANGNVTIDNIPYGKYEMRAIPPEPNNDYWVQTLTIEGTQGIDAWLEEGTDGRGAIREFLIEPGLPTAYLFGFVGPCTFGDPSDTCAFNDDMTGGTGTLIGTAKNWVVFPPFEQLTFGEPVYRPWIVLTDIGNSDTMVHRTRGNPDGSFVINNVPAGTYQMVIWDEPLDYIIQFRTVVVGDGEVVNMGDVGVFRWFGWVSGHVFLDDGRDSTGAFIGGPELAGNAIRDCANPADPATCERGLSNTDLLLRFRDGSVQTGTFTDVNGFYEFPEARGPLGKFQVAEVGFGRFGISGHSKHDEHFANIGPPFADNVTVVPGDLGGDLLLNQLTWEGKRSIIDWGKRIYDLNADENGGISGAVLYAVTRNEFNASLALAEDYEPGIPGVTVQLWGAGPDEILNTPEEPSFDDVLLYEVQTDGWEHPSSANGNPCDVKDSFGGFLTGLIYDLVSDRCLEVPMVANETQDGAWDGGWAIDVICPNGWPCDESEEVPMPSGDYIVQVVPPPFYQILKEEDQNTDEGDDLIPQVPPPPCVGDLHLVMDDRNPYNGTMMPLCDKKFVTVQTGQNPAADFFLFTTDQAYVTQVDPESERTSWNTSESVPVPGRFFGLVEDDINLNTDPNSLTYGEKRGVPYLPVGIYDYQFRLITTIYTDENGFYEVLLPSTYTALCPIPSGICPGMYIIIPNDPNSPDFSGAYIVDPVARDIWPGKMTPADTPVDPINTLVCSVALDTPQIFRTSHVTADNTLSVSLTITGTRFGTDPLIAPRVTLDDDDGVSDAFDLTVTSWVPASVDINNPGDPANVFEDVVTATVPAGLAGGPYQLSVISGPVHVELDTGPFDGGGKPSLNGLTLHVLGADYSPPIITVFPPASLADTPIQTAINAATPGSLVIVSPGTYHENVIMHKGVKLQGFGPGGAVGAPPAVTPDPPPEPPDPFDPPTTVPGEEPYAHIQGSVIDGRFYTFDADRRADWDATLAGPASPYSGPSEVRPGAGITVVAQDGEFVIDPKFGASIDGFGITASRGEAGGAIYVHAYGRGLRISNNILEANQGRHGGAVSVGQPSFFGGLLDNENDNIVIRHNRILSNGGVFLAGGVGIFNGADNYEFANNDVCGNFSLEYGGGISHFGRSPNGSIHDNLIYFNSAFDEGGGIMVAGELPAGFGGIGSGDVTIAYNNIESNLSNDDGGGMMLLRPLEDTVNIFNNMINGNVATDFGGGIALDDASDVSIINNTIAYNISTATAEDADRTSCSPVPPQQTCPHGAGLVSTAYSSFFTPADGSTFSDPVLFNNIFWENEAFYWDGALPISAGLIDLEVIGSSGLLDPNNSLLSVAYGPPDASNVIGVDPLFVLAVPTDFNATPDRFNLTTVFVEIMPPEGTLIGFSNYHILEDSPAIDIGASADPAGSGLLPPSDDYDHEPRPQGAAFDAGADEFFIAPPELYFSTASATTAIPGVQGPYDDADIYAWSGTQFFKIFDAIDNGFALGVNMDAVVVVDNDTFYFSVVAPTTILGLPVDDSDIALYDAGAVSMVFDGSDVGVSTDAEDVDAFEILSDGSVLISTIGPISVPGIPGLPRDDSDLLRCAGTFGPATTCMWSLYFDASDVGMTAPSEDVTGVDVAGGSIYLTTLGAFSVPGLSGGGEDVFVCNSPTTGASTSCASFSMYFDGSAEGVTGSLDAVAFTGDGPASPLVGLNAGGNSANHLSTLFGSPRVRREFIAGQLLGSNTSYAWDFGDGTTASGAIVEHAYTFAGTYTLLLTARDGATASIMQYEVIVDRFRNIRRNRDFPMERQK